MWITHDEKYQKIIKPSETRMDGKGYLEELPNQMDRPVSILRMTTSAADTP